MSESPPRDRPDGRSVGADPTSGERGPSIRHVLETVLYVDDLHRATAFYEGVLGLGCLVSTDGFCALDAGGGTVLLLFVRGSAADGADTEGGRIPAHDGHGRGHVAFAVASEQELEVWTRRLEADGMPIESRVRWPRGGASVYVRDPDGHSVELASPGIWPTY